MLILALYDPRNGIPDLSILLLQTVDERRSRSLMADFVQLMQVFLILKRQINLTTSLIRSSRKSYFFHAVDAFVQRLRLRQ